MFYCLVVGSRGFDNYNLMKERLDYLLQNQKDITIVSGGARGADSLAERYAHENGYALKVFPADWNTFGRRAGYIRNKQMHEYIAQFPKRGVVAFWDMKSSGTKLNFPLSKEFSNRCVVVNSITGKIEGSPDKCCR